MVKFRPDSHSEDPEFWKDMAEGLDLTSGCPPFNAKSAIERALGTFSDEDRLLLRMDPDSKMLVRRPDGTIEETIGEQ